MTKYILAFIGALVIAGAIYGAYLYPTPTIQNIVSSGGVGSSFNNSKQVAIDMAPLTSGATSTSILNTDDGARWLGDFDFAGCTGVGTSQTYLTGTGLSSLLVQAATTSVANQGLQGNTNYSLNMLIPTSTALVSTSSSTPPSSFGYWPSGSYMTITFNATNTAACVVEMDYIPS